MARVYFGQIGILRLGKEHIYKKLHEDVWPGVLERIKECNIRNYSIFIHKLQVFSYYEYIGSDYEEDMKKMEQDSKTQEWWTCTHPCFEPYAVDSSSAYYHDMQQIFYYKGE